MSPYKAARQCRNRQCPGTTVDASGYCEKCKPLYYKPWQKNNQQYKRMGGRRLQTINKVFMREHPLCEECLRHGVHTMAVVRDHIIPLAEGGEDTTENSQALCYKCHDAKTREEARRGREK